MEQERKWEERKDRTQQIWEIEVQRGWICEMGCWTDCGRRRKKNKGEKRGEEDVVQTSVNYIRQNWYTYFIFSDRAWGGGNNGMWMYVTTDMLGCSNMHNPAWHDLGVTHDLWQHQDVSQLSTKRELGHQKQYGAHSSTTLTFTKPLSMHSLYTLYNWIFKYSHLKEALLVAYAIMRCWKGKIKNSLKDH